MENVVTGITANIDFLYIVLCNIVTWLAIETIKMTKHKDRLTTWMKRCIATILAFGLGALMNRCFDRPFEPIFYGFFIQYLSWDYFFKTIVERIKNVISGKSNQ